MHQALAHKKIIRISIDIVMRMRIMRSIGHPGRMEGKVQKTLYRHADGTLQAQPAREGHGGKIIQRYNAVQVDTDGTRIFERTAEIRTRSLQSVGGGRGKNGQPVRKPRSRYTGPTRGAPKYVSAIEGYGLVSMDERVRFDRSKYIAADEARKGRR